MAVLGRATFEVQVHREGRWAINEVLPSEEAARAKAQSLLTQKGIGGVKIIKETKTLDESGSSMMKTA